MPKHRAFTYEEKKFNQLGRDGLIEYFKPKISPEKVQDMMFEKHKQDVTLADSKRIARHIEEKEWKENEKRRDFTLSMVDAILLFSNQYDITNIEALAMTLHLYKAMGGKKAMTQQEIGRIMDRALPGINKLRLENWDRFMRILKEVS